MSEVRGDGQRRHHGSEVRGRSLEELPHVRDQWQPEGDTPRPRSGAARRSHLTPEARVSDPEDPP